MENVLKNIIARIELYNINDTKQLKDRKVINELKIKRNTKRGSIKANYNMMITILESEYKTNYIIG